MVDASIAIKWYLPEVHDDAARRVLLSGYDLLAPDLIFCEVGNILWKRCRAAQMLEAEAQEVLRSLVGLSLSITQSSTIAQEALVIACETKRTVYDSLYLALAVRENALMVTADEKLVNAVKATPLAQYLLWVADVP